ncbi:4-(cytidine 5'-diphospho)-2-C-methyl-D-erythritol kinase [Avibacterium paragallinarum]|uniref:4-(cytidine 5'-diphospho)-2-C-methyl-D-erythritol kinase n=1 Tax=Avibacterium paragallinarum TaxID=728 RepID=UPI00397A8F98
MKNYHFSSTPLSTHIADGKYRFPSPAKLNLFLYINGQLENGYHELQTLFQFLDFGDWLEIEIRQDPQIILSPAFSKINVTDNLVFRAAKLLQQYTHCHLGANIYLDKILPMGGGIGGGSSNAATTLVALNALWNTQCSLNELAELGLQLGADVPIFIHGKAAFAEGIGEKIQYCNPQEKWYVVLNPNISISTQAIFQDPNLPRNTPKKTLQQLLTENYTNDCEKIVRDHYPEVEELLKWLLQYAPARLTGTGACVFAEFDDPGSAHSVFLNKPKNCFGFVAQGINLSPLHKMMKDL